MSGCSIDAQERGAQTEDDVSLNDQSSVSQGVNVIESDDYNYFVQVLPDGRKVECIKYFERHESSISCNWSGLYNQVDPQGD